MIEGSQRSREDKVREFHHVMGLGVGAEMTSANLSLRVELISEEFLEFVAEVALCKTFTDKGEEVPVEVQVNLLKELADLQYVISGFAVNYELPLSTAFNIVHESNMSKFDPETGQPILNEAGKVMKGKNYKPANLLPLFKQQKEI